jgi:hypothetical protein
LRADGAWASEFSLYARRTPVSDLVDRKTYASYSALAGRHSPAFLPLRGARMMKTSTSAHKSGRQLARSASGHALASTVCALWLGTALAAGGAHAESGVAAITCTNSASGATWQIHIDYDRHTVDSSPAVISDGAVEWQENNGWKYSLDRKSGKLTVVLASSTGGNFLYDQCKLDK